MSRNECGTIYGGSRNIFENCVAQLFQKTTFGEALLTSVPNHDDTKNSMEKIDGTLHTSIHSKYFGTKIESLAQTEAEIFIF